MAGALRLHRPRTPAGRGLSAGASRAAGAWRNALDAWAIPPHILEQAEESPWYFPVAAFAAKDAGQTLSHRRALDALPDGGTVLDIGIGGGAMSRPLRPTAGRVIGVDSQESMLAGCGADETVLGRWPDVAASVEPVDVVVCGHVVYNVADLDPFVRALGAAARGRVVVELTDRHPLVEMAPLWRRFWDLDRPTGPKWRDFMDVVSEAGIDAQAEERSSSGGGISFGDLDGLATFVRRRLCLRHPRSR